MTTKTPLVWTNDDIGLFESGAAPNDLSEQTASYVKRIVEFLGKLGIPRLRQPGLHGGG